MLDWLRKLIGRAAPNIQRESIPSGDSCASQRHVGQKRAGRHADARRPLDVLRGASRRRNAVPRSTSDGEQQ